MNTNGQPINMNAVREHYRLKHGVNVSRTLVGLVGE